MFSTFVLAGTHAFLRRELIGGVLGNGTLSGRLKHYSCIVTGYIQSGRLPAYPKARSLKVLMKLCKIMLKLMCILLRQSLFHCHTCEKKADQNGGQVPVACIDGIHQGYLRSQQFALQNISKKFEPSVPSEASQQGNMRLPLARILRLASVVRLLISALNGKAVICGKDNVSCFAACIRRVQGVHFLPRFCSGSICGRVGNDYLQDIGENSYVAGLRKFLMAFFDKSVMLSCLINPLKSFHFDQIHAGNIHFLKSIGARESFRQKRISKERTRVIL